MSADPRADVVSAQYRSWVYPAPIEDVSSWLVSNWQWFDPSHSYLSLWPDRDYRPDMRILVAGCGTSQAAVLAYTNPSAHVVAIDVSESSLDHHHTLKAKHGLDNLDLHCLPIEEAGAMGGDFDLIVSTGVLHHLADPNEGARVLGGMLAPDGVLAVMLYARYGRIGVEMLQGVFRDLGLVQDEASLAVVRQAMDTLPSDHPVRRYVLAAPDLDFDAGLVDTFLHGRDRSYTVTDCLDLVTAAGLAFQGWFLKAPYEPQQGAGNAFLEAVAALPDVQRWSAMERVNGNVARHFFTAVRADRMEKSYRIDFASADRSRYIPAFRFRCRLEGGTVVGPNRRLPMGSEQIAIAQQIDGRRTLGDIAAKTAKGFDFGDAARPEVESVVARVVDGLWRQDMVALGLPPHR